MAKNEVRVKFLAETEPFREAIKKANSSLTELRSEMKLSEATFKGNEQSVEALTQKKRILQDQLDATKAKVDALQQTLDKAKTRYDENSTEVQKLKTQLNNAQRQYVETEHAINGVNTELNQQEQEVEQTTTAMHGLDGAMEKCNNGFTVMKGVVANLVTDGIRLLIDGLKEAAKYALTTGMDFEAGMSQVKATSGASATEMEQLTEKAKEMGAKTKFSATESAEAFNYMAMAGWKTGDMLDGIEGVMGLAAAANTDLGTASDIVTDALTAMGYAAGDAGRLADVMAAASSNANTNVEMMGGTFKYAAPVAGSLGISMEDLAIATGLMANAGIKGEQAGTTLRAGLTNLVKPSQQAADAMDKYGISITNSDGSVKPLSETMEILRQKLGQLPEAEQAAAAAAIFGKEAMSGWLSVINASDADVDKLTQAIYNSEGAAEEMAATMQDNLKGDIEQLGGAFDTLAINVSQKFNGALREGVQAITGFLDGSKSMSEMFDGLRSAMQQAIDGIRSYMPQLAQMGGELILNLAQGIVSGAPKLVSSASNIISNIGQGIANNAQKIVSMGGELIMNLGKSIISAAGQLMSTGAEIIKSLASGITGNTQSFISKGLDLLDGFADTLTSGVPKLIQNGMEFIRNLVKGLMNSLPELISRVPEIISKFANVINDNAPKIIAGGVGIIKDLIVGILKAIPTLVQNIPKIITAIVDVWEAFNWLALGKKAIDLLGKGIKSMFNFVKSAGKGVLDAIVNVIKNLPQNLLDLGKKAITGMGNGIKSLTGSIKSAATSIFNAVVDNVKNLPQKLLQIGKDLVTGLWNGISDMTGWVIGKIQGFGESVLGGIKRFFGINSPSTVLRDEVGQFLPAGLGEGIEENEDAALEPMQGIVDKIKGIDVAGEWGKLSGVGGALNYDVSAQLGDYVAEAVNSNSQLSYLEQLAAAIEDLASRPVSVSVGDREIIKATVSANDSISGMRNTFRSRGLALE